MVIGADVLLLDEPFSAVDELTRDRLNLELLSAHARAGSTVVLVTHNLQEAVLLSDRVVVMTPRPGRVSLQLDVPFDRPRTTDLLRSPELAELTFRARQALHDPDDAGTADAVGWDSRRASPPPALVSSNRL